MGESLTEMNDQMLNVATAVESESVSLFLFCDSLAVYTFAHDIVEILDWNRTEIQYFDDLDFQVDSVGHCPCLYHGVHHFAWILIQQDSDQIDYKVLNTLFHFKAT